MLFFTSLSVMFVMSCQTGGGAAQCACVLPEGWIDTSADEQLKLVSIAD